MEPDTLTNELQGVQPQRKVKGMLKNLLKASLIVLFWIALGELARLGIWKWVYFHATVPQAYGRAAEAFFIDHLLRFAVAMLMAGHFWRVVDVSRNAARVAGSILGFIGGVYYTLIGGGIALPTVAILPSDTNILMLVSFSFLGFLAVEMASKCAEWRGDPGKRE